MKVKYIIILVFVLLFQVSLRAHETVNSSYMSKKISMLNCYEPLMELSLSKSVQPSCILDNIQNINNSSDKIEYRKRRNMDSKSSIEAAIWVTLAIGFVCLVAVTYM